MRILVVDDHQMLCVALSEHLQRAAAEILSRTVEVIPKFTLSDGIEELRRPSPPTLVFLDLTLDGGNRGASTFHRFQEVNEGKVPVVLFTGLSLDNSATIETLRECLFLTPTKALGVVLKQADIDSALVGLRRLLVGERWIPDEVMTELVKEGPKPIDYRAHLTPRQFDVARCLARGLQDRQIARELNLSPLFVRQVASQIYRRLGVRNRGGAVNELHRRGYLSSAVAGSTADPDRLDS